jgi:acyl-coenzyme A thioesterase PaaI-like protein
VTTEMRYSTYCQLRNDSHPDCMVCGSGNGHGLGLEFHVTEDGIAEASFACDRVFQGYPGVLHGGVISALLDGVMTNHLFAQDIVAVTAELTVRFRYPVATNNPATIRAWITSSLSPLHELAAELIQNGQVKATAKGKFLDKSFVSWF